MARNLFIDTPLIGEQGFVPEVPGSVSHLGEKLLNLDAGATVTLTEPIYEEKAGPDGSPRSVLVWQAGEQVRPEVAERAATKTPLQNLEPSEELLMFKGAENKSMEPKEETKSDEPDADSEKSDKKEQ